MRINKYLSQIGICSRREADKLVDSGRIKVNNEIAILGTKIKEADKITIDNKLINYDQLLIYNFIKQNTIIKRRHSC